MKPAKRRVILYQFWVQVMTNNEEIVDQSRESHRYKSPAIFLASHCRWRDRLGLSWAEEAKIVAHSPEEGQEMTNPWSTSMEVMVFTCGIPCC